MRVQYYNILLVLEGLLFYKFVFFLLQLMVSKFRDPNLGSKMKNKLSDMCINKLSR